MKSFFAVALLWGGALFLSPMVQAAEHCEKFGECIQQVLNHQSPADRVLYATQALQRWSPEVPQRDLLNVLKLRGEALIALHLTGSVPDLNPLHHATSDYQRFLELDPEHWLPLSGLGRIAELQNNLGDAEAFFSRAVKTGKSRAYAARGAFYTRQQRWKPAVEDFAQSLRRDEQDRKRDMGMPSVERAEVYYLRGLAYGQMKQALDERLDFESACKLGHAEACEALK